MSRVCKSNLLFYDLSQIKMLQSNINNGVDFILGFQISPEVGEQNDFFNFVLIYFRLQLGLRED